MNYKIVYNAIKNNQYGNTSCYFERMCLEYISKQFDNFAYWFGFIKSN